MSDHDAGGFTVAREIWDHPVLGSDDPYSKREAWLWMVSAAAWKPHRVCIAGHVLHLERGEFSFSIRFMEKKFGWRPGRVERFLEVLKKHDMIRDTSRDGTKVYFISKYNGYQLGGKEERDTSRDNVATAPRQHRDKEESRKPREEKKEQETSISLADASLEGMGEDQPDPKPTSKPKTKPKCEPAGFAEWYEAYPLKKARPAAAKAYAKARAKAEEAALLTGAARYAASRLNEDPKFTAHPATWLNNERWKDEESANEQPGRQEHREAHRRTSGSGTFFDACVDGVRSDFPGGGVRQADHSPPRGTITVLPPSKNDARGSADEAEPVRLRSAGSF